MLMNIFSFKSIPLCNIHVKDGNCIQCKGGKKYFFFTKWVNTTLKMRIKQEHSIFFTNYKFYNGHIQLLGKAYVHHSENYALFMYVSNWLSATKGFKEYIIYSHVLNWNYKLISVEFVC